MLAQTDLDTALTQAQEAVDSLAQNVSALQPAVNVVQPFAERAAQPAVSPRKTGSRTTPSSLPEHLRRILRLRVPVIVRVAQRPILLNDVLKLIPGNILEFDREVHQELDLLVNNHQIGTGVAVKINEHFGIKINSIGEPRDRVRQLTE